MIVGLAVALAYVVPMARGLEAGKCVLELQTNHGLDRVQEHLREHLTAIGFQVETKQSDAPMGTG